MEEQIEQATAAPGEKRPGVGDLTARVADLLHPMEGYATVQVAGEYRRLRREAADRIIAVVRAYDSAQ